MVHSLGLKKVDFSFHGGEPSLRIDLIEAVTSEISCALGDKGITVRFSMVTNGTLIGNSSLKSLIASGLDRMLFTIDGPPEIHDLRRPFSSGKETFQEIYANMKNTLESGMKIYLGINIDKHNCDSMHSLLRKLSEDFGSYENLQIIFAFVTPGKEPGAFCNRYCFGPLDDKANTMMNLYEMAHSLGLNTADPMGSPYCTARTLSDVIISPTGGVYKCTSLVGQEESHVGTILKGPEAVIKASAEFAYGWNTYEHSQQCRECSFMPICLGGCIAESILSGRRRSCKKSFFEDLLPRIILFRLRQRKK
jgi:uncharacterized protein